MSENIITSSRYICRLKSQVSKTSLHEALKSRGTITQPRWHPCEFPQPKWCNKCCLLNVIVCHGHFMVTRGKVKHTEVFGSTKCLERLIIAMEWVGALAFNFLEVEVTRIFVGLVEPGQYQYMFDDIRMAQIPVMPGEDAGMTSQQVKKLI